MGNLPPTEKSKRLGISVYFRISRFLEKPQDGVTALRLASVVFYCLRKATLPYLSDFLTLQPQAQDRTFGRFWVSIRTVNMGIFGFGLSSVFNSVTSGSELKFN